MEHTVQHIEFHTCLWTIYVLFVCFKHWLCPVSIIHRSSNTRWVLLPLFKTYTPLLLNLLSLIKLDSYKLFSIELIRRQPIHLNWDQAWTNFNTSSVCMGMYSQSSLRKRTSFWFNSYVSVIFGTLGNKLGDAYIQRIYLIDRRTRLIQTKNSNVPNSFFFQ